MSQAHVQVVLGGQTLPKPLEGALRRVGATASFGPISEVLRLGLKPTADAVVVVAPEDAEARRDGLRALFDRVAAQPRATLVLQPEGGQRQQPAFSRALPVSFSSRVNEEELAVRLLTMIEMRGPLESLHRSSTATPHPEEAFAQHYRRQLRMASQLQREFLPHALPRCGRLSFAAVYRPADYVSGDIYDVRRVDDDHVAVALVDAQGHGICAALLTVFIKRALYGGNGRRGEVRVPRPDEVLRRLNEELLDVTLTEFQFVAAVYAVLNLRTRRVDLARGGAPYPIIRQAGGRCRLVRPAGIVVGVVPEPFFEVESFELGPGESLILYSDGLEHVVRTAEGAWPPTASRANTQRRRRRNGIAGRSQRDGASPAALVASTAVATAQRPADLPEAAEVMAGAGGDFAVPDDSSASAAPDEVIITTDWYRRLERNGVPAALDHLTARYDTLRRLGHSLDDLAVLAINQR